MEYLGTLSDGAVPSIQKLTTAPDPQIAIEAQQVLENHDCSYEDIRGWNFAAWKAIQ